MGKFLEFEKFNQVHFKTHSRTISTPAQVDGIYKSPLHPYPFCLPREHAAENLYPPIRSSIRTYFERNKIKWHDGQNGNPSNHMCDSQVCCANYLFPFADQPQALAALLKPIFPELSEMLPIECGLYVAFEWIGGKNYLGEKISRNGIRTRGANYTSADAAVRFLRTDGLTQISLIEWKYSESYYGTCLETAASGQSRVAIYQHLWDSPGCPLHKELLPGFEVLFYEPFYQLMRQQFLADQMEEAHELGADVVSLLHISPAHNLDFKRVTSPGLRATGLGNSPTETWQRVVRHPGRFISVNTEDLFGSFDPTPFEPMIDWKEYIDQRYPWVTKKPSDKA